MDWVTLRSRGKELVRKYRYVLLVVLAGLFLMALPDGKNAKAAPEPAAAETRRFRFLRSMTFFWSGVH